MFHKDQSISGHGRKNQKAMDVPIRKSDRRKVLDRAKAYFRPVLEAAVEDAANDKEVLHQRTSSLMSLLEATFLHGNLSARSISMEGGKAFNMILYLKTPSSRSAPTESIATSSKGMGNVLPPMEPVWPYSASSQFVWMALEEKHAVVHETPTVALWAILMGHQYLSVEQLLRHFAVQVPYAVSKYVCRGADLMRAGMRSLPQPPLSSPTESSPNSKKKKKNSAQLNSLSSLLVPIVVQGNPQPFAVGLVKNPLDRVFGIGTKGVGVEIWNAYGDDLWRFGQPKKDPGVSGSKIDANAQVHVNMVGGSPFDDGNYGNVGFQAGKLVLPLVEQGSGVEVAPGSDDEDEVEEETITTKSAWDEPTETSKDTMGETSRKGDDAHSEQKSEPQQPPHPVDDEAVPAAEEVLSPDEVLHLSVCRGLLSLKNKDLPMLLSTFYAQNVVPNRPDDTQINLKATTYKKFGNYIKAQVSRGLLLVGPDKKNPKNKDPMALLIGYHKKHKDLQGIEKPATNDSTAASGSDSSSRKLVMVKLYVIPNHWPALLRLAEEDVKAMNATSEERKGTGMLTAPEVRKILEAYLEREELIPSLRPDQAILDAPLTKVLFPKQDKTPESLLRKDLVKQFTAKLLPAYALVEMPGSKITQLGKGRPPSIEIEVSMRASKKFVTRVRGLEDYGIDAEYFSKDVARRLACSSTIETTAPSGRPALRKNHVELVFQGNIVDELEALLANDDSLSSHGGVKDSEYQVPKQVLDVTLRKGVPGRKKGSGRKK